VAAKKTNKSKSAAKRHRQSERRRMRNRTIRSQVRGAITAVRVAVASSDLARSTAALRTAERLLGKAVTKGVLHRNAVSRHLSRLSRHLNALRAAASG
jgi:small subunit ribosomal protein S20